MNVILFLATAISLIISITIFKALLKDIKNNSFNKKEIPLILLALCYLALSVIQILWLTKNLPLQSQDSLSIISIILAIQTSCILTIFSEINENKKSLYFLIAYIFLIPLIKSSLSLIHIAIPISLLITLLVFLGQTTVHERATRYLILYTSVSLLLYIPTTFFESLAQIFILISSALFLVFIFPFLKFLKLQTGGRFLSKIKKESPLIHFLKHLIFIIIITNFIFIGTVSMHEFGHLLSSNYSNCEQAKIVYELKGLPHTKIECIDQNEKNFWILGGIIPPLIIALFLFLSGGKFIKEIAMQIAGFDLIISYLDIISLNISKSLATFSIIAGIGMVAFSLALLAKSRIE